MRNRFPLNPPLARTLLISTIAAGLNLASPIAAQAADVTFDFVMSASGTASFDADNNPGNDQNATNNIIRTQDFITYQWKYAINNGAANNVVLKATVPANAVITIPAVCNPTGSSLTVNPANGEQSINCAIETVPSGSSGAIDLKVRILGQERVTNQFVGQGDTTQATGSLTGDAISNPVTPKTLAPLTISARPKADLLKDRAYVEGAALGQDGVTQGLVVRYPITIAITGGGKGSEALVGNISFTDELMFRGGPNAGQLIPGAQLYTWRPGYGGANVITPGTTSGCNLMGGDAWSYYGGLPNGKINSSRYPQYGTPEWSTGDSGNWSCSQSAPGQPITLSITGADTTGNHVPTRDYYGGNVLPTDRTYLVAGTIHLWVPVSAVTAAGGQLDVRNRVSPLVINGASGQPNQEPTLANNEIDHTLVSTNGSFTTYYSKNVDERGTPLIGMSAIYGGDGPVMPGQVFADRIYLHNNGVLDWRDTTILCTTIDNETQSVTPLSSDPSSGVKNFSYHGTAGVDYVIEYGTGNFATPADHKRATCQDSDSPTGWTNNLQSVPGRPRRCDASSTTGAQTCTRWSCLGLCGEFDRSQYLPHIGSTHPDRHTISPTW
jgi:hypothetical protein